MIDREALVRDARDFLRGNFEPSTVKLMVDFALKVLASQEGAQATITVLGAKIKRLKSALEPFADIADLIECETEGFSDTDELQLTFHDYLFQNFSVAKFKVARAAMGDRDA